MSATPPKSMNVGLKEWAVVCQAMADGRQVVLLRKGGIYESGGEFELEHRQFLFFPTYLHQNLAMLKEDARGAFEARSAEPERVTLAVAGEVTDILEVKSRAAMDALNDQHVWEKPLIDMRFNYKPANPLYLMIVRAWRLKSPLTVENTPAYAGCKSWVPLERSVETADAAPALDEAAFQERRQLVRGRLDGVATV